MQFSFLGYSVKKIMELDLDVKDVTILRFFDDFRQSGRMNYEVIEGVNYYWISYQNIENELPFLGLGKRSIMMRMLKLRDLGVLSHYTKKEGGTFSYYALGEKYRELLYIKNNNDSNNNDSNASNDSDSTGGQAIGYYDATNVSRIGQDIYQHNTISNYNDGESTNYLTTKFNSKESADSFSNDYTSTMGQATLYYNEENKFYNGEDNKEDSNKVVDNNEEDIQNNIQGIDYLKDFEDSNYKKEERVYSNNHRGYTEKCSTNTHLLNNSSTILTNIYNNIKDKVSSIINYLNSKVGVMYKASNTKTVNLVKARLKDGFTIEDFKTVIDKKVKAWKGTIFEQYLTPFTLFGEKFEVYLNQKIVKSDESKNNNSYGNKISYSGNKKLKFDNFKGREYDYDELEKKLLGWDDQ
ncbi:conserved phage C-terminal domain-containing protein [Clostridium sp. HCS.1]|uniref:conserved phage C-terminal domain-containing protein n=1 Tax=Clostridium sp. HCS.1 TaxID=3238594 RepID=UPI003A0FF964